MTKRRWKEDHYRGVKYAIAILKEHGPLTAREMIQYWPQMHQPSVNELVNGLRINKSFVIVDENNYANTYGVK